MKPVNINGDSQRFTLRLVIGALVNARMRNERVIAVGANVG